MKYIAGSLMTLVAMFIASRIIFRNVPKNEKNMYRYSQSHIHHLVHPLLPPTSKIKKRIRTQAIKHFEKTNLRVIIVDDDAYWIKDNVLYTGKITPNGVDKETASVVDTMSMDKVQLDKMLFIMDKLRDGKSHDSGSAGDK